MSNDRNYPKRNSEGYLDMTAHIAVCRAEAAAKVARSRERYVSTMRCENGREITRRHKTHSAKR